VTASRLRGTAAAPIEIRAFPGERPVIDASLEVFARDPGRAWTRARGPGAAPDEYVSAPFEEALGIPEEFLSEPYQRLLTYTRHEDLRAREQVWRRLPLADPTPGAVMVDDEGRARGRRPWTYFGPGLYFDARTRRVHIRLAPTAHGAPGVPDYRGPDDPRTVPLAISRRADRALALLVAAPVRSAALSRRHGGGQTGLGRGGPDIVLDHVDVRAASYGVFVDHVDGFRLLHSRIDGGLPVWSFRSDWKDDYRLREPSGALSTNNLVRSTQRALLYLAGGIHGAEVAYCEIGNGHDVYVAGNDTEIHHNHLRRIHDEALFMSHVADVDRLRIHHNVVEQVLSAVSFSSRKGIAGRRFVYRNLFDLREPTAGYRPDGTARLPWRYGHPFKTSGALGAIFFYQNDLLIARPSNQAASLFFRALEKEATPAAPRWFLNNLVLVLTPDADSDRPVAFVPHPAYLTARQPDGEPLLRSDGNLWVRHGVHGAPLFRCFSNVRGVRCPPGRLARLADLRAERLGGLAGFERSSREADEPGFVRVSDLARPRPGDDLRPGPGSPARAAGVPLPAMLPGADPSEARPDIGAFAAASPALRVGIDGQRRY
jgi:hypothetical protein